MSIQIRLHPLFQQFTDGQDVVITKGRTVGECLQYLINQFPRVKQRLYDKNGKLANFVEIYVNAESSYPEELAKAVKDGDEITIVAIISGG